MCINLSSKLFVGSMLILCCAQSPPHSNGKQQVLSAVNYEIVDTKQNLLLGRFNPPEGFKRVACDSLSFGYYLQHLPLKPHGSIVKYYDGTEKQEAVYDAVVDMEISKRDLQQCADAVMRLRGEYLFSIGAYSKISFTLTNGFKMDYAEWMKGKRLKVSGNKTWWEQTAQASNTHQDFRNYMEVVFTYAGTLSLSKTLNSKSLKTLQIGDVFIYGGSPGHAVIVVDMAQNKAGEKMFLLAQSYMPAQETQILKNPNNPSISPWYKADFDEVLETPQWTFAINALKGW